MYVCVCVGEFVYVYVCESWCEHVKAQVYKAKAHRYARMRTRKSAHVS